MLRTDDAGQWTMDAGRWTLDAGPSTPYYKLTGELKTCVEKVSLKYDFRVAPCHGHTHLTSSYRPNSGGIKENQSFETNGLSRVKLN